MPLSKARNRARNRLLRAEKRGEQPTSNLALSCLPPDERKAVLKEIALSAIEKPISAGHKIAAIKELNLMEHVYDPQPSVERLSPSIVLNIFQVVDQRRQETLMAGNSLQEATRQPETIVEASEPEVVL